MKKISMLLAMLWVLLQGIGYVQAQESTAKVDAVQSTTENNKKTPSKQELIRWIVEKIKNNLNPDLAFVGSNCCSITLKGNFTHVITFDNITRVWYNNTYTYKAGGLITIYGKGFYRKYGRVKALDGEYDIDQDKPQWEIGKFINLNGEKDLCDKLGKAFRALVEYNEKEDEIQ